MNPAVGATSVAGHDECRDGSDPLRGGAWCQSWYGEHHTAHGTTALSGLSRHRCTGQQGDMAHGIVYSICLVTNFDDHHVRP